MNICLVTAVSCQEVLYLCTKTKVLSPLGHCYTVCRNFPVPMFIQKEIRPNVSYKDVSKSSRTALLKRSLLTLDVKFPHHLQSTPLLHEYNGPSVSAMLRSIPGSPFSELCQVPAAIPLESLQWCRIFDPSSEALAWGREKIHRGPDRVSMGVGEHCRVVRGQKLRNFEGLIYIYLLIYSIE